jgi:signal transduction histidine kinase
MPPSNASQKTPIHQSDISRPELIEPLAQAAAILNSTLDFDEVLDHILEQTLLVANCRSVNILLMQEQAIYRSRRLSHDTGIRIVTQNNENILPQNFSSLQSMLITGKPVLIPDTDADPSWLLLPGEEAIKSYAGAPLKIGNEVVGFLNVESGERSFFSEETIQRLSAFAAHASIAIQNAHLYQQIQQYANKLEDHIRERTAELQEAKEYIEGILASVPDAVFVLNENRNLEHANQAGEKLLSAAKQEGLDLFGHESLVQMISGAAPTEKNILEVQDRAYQPLASNLWLDGNPAGKVLVFRDVTRFRELDKMKTKFVSDVSHELRTPLTNMTIYLDLLKSVQEPVKQELYIETLRRETSRFTHLIEDLLTISRLEAGRVDMYIKPTDINHLIRELVADRSIMANSKGLFLAFEPSENLPLALVDSRLVVQAVSNLLTNAINYTDPEGFVSLRTQKMIDSTSTWVIISIIDNGVGIPPDEIGQIFDRFYRGTASYRTKAQGTGLGLPISKEIIEGMGGRISVKSLSEVGSTFTVWLRAVL